MGSRPQLELGSARGSDPLDRDADEARDGRRADALAEIELRLLLAERKKAEDNLDPARVEEIDGQIDDFKVEKEGRTEEPSATETGDPLADPLLGPTSIEEQGQADAINPVDRPAESLNISEARDSNMYFLFRIRFYPEPEGWFIVETKNGIEVTLVNEQ